MTVPVIGELGKQKRPVTGAFRLIMLAPLSGACRGCADGLHHFGCYRRH